MAAKPEETVKKEIKEHIDKSGYPYSEWYVGISDDPEDRLFNDHKVEKKSWWIYRECFNSEAARRVEEYLINTLGTKGDVGGGDEKSIFVYAYKITNSTVE